MFFFSFLSIKILSLDCTICSSVVPRTFFTLDLLAGRAGWTTAAFRDFPRSDRDGGVRRLLIARPPRDEPGTDGDVDSSLEDFVVIQSSRYFRRQEDSGTSDLQLRTRELTYNLNAVSSDQENVLGIAEDIEGVQDGYRAPPNTANDLNMQNAETFPPAPEFVVQLGQSLTSFVSNLADITNLEPYSAEEEEESVIGIVDMVSSLVDMDTSSPPTRSPIPVSNRQTRPLNLEFLLESSLLQSPANNTITSPPQLQAVNLTEDVSIEPILVQPLNNTTGRAHNCPASLVEERPRSNSCPTRPRLPSTSDVKRKRAEANLSTLDSLDTALLEPALTTVDTGEATELSAILAPSTPPQSANSFSSPNITSRLPALSRLRPLPSRQSGIPPPDNCQTPRTGSTAASSSRPTKPTTKKARRNRE